MAVQTTQITENISETDLRDMPLDLLERHWSSAFPLTRKLSSECSEFLLVTVEVTTSLSDRRHDYDGKPNILHSRCAVYLKLQTGNPNVPLHKLYVDAHGWTRVEVHSDFPQSHGRKVSRFPKLNPGRFFPYTQTILYCDTKWLHFISKRDARAWADKLLDGTSFGIVQHPVSKTMHDEHAAIMEASRTRPTITYSKETLKDQINYLNASLTPKEQHLFAVEGKLHAHNIRRGSGNSRLFDRVWLNEYMHGGDRDQIAFFGAAARMQLRMHIDTDCPKLNFGRAGFYVSDYDPNFTMRIHCDFDSLAES